jgi:hypothetical protein
LECIVLRIVFDMTLMILEVFDNVLLLAKLSVEELRVALELIAQTLVRCIKELCFITNSLEERVIDFILDVV